MRTRPEPRRTPPDFDWPARQPAGDGLHHNLGLQDFIMNASEDRSPIHMETVMAWAIKRNPMRMRRIRKDMAWLTKLAKEQGIPDPPIPEWMRP